MCVCVCVFFSFSWLICRIQDRTYYLTQGQSVYHWSLVGEWLVYLPIHLYFYLLPFFSLFNHSSYSFSTSHWRFIVTLCWVVANLVLLRVKLSRKNSIIIIIMLRRQNGSPWLSLATRLYCPSLPVSLQSYIGAELLFIGTSWSS